MADELVRDGNFWLAKGAEASLPYNGEDLSPVAFGRLVQRDAIEPVALGVGSESSDRVSSDVKVGHVISGKVRGEATARTFMLSLVLEANCLGVI